MRVNEEESSYCQNSAACQRTLTCRDLKESLLRMPLKFILGLSCSCFVPVIHNICWDCSYFFCWNFNMAEIGISRRASTGLTWLGSTRPLVLPVIFRFCYFEGKEGRRKKWGRKKERERGQREERRKNLRREGGRATLDEVSSQFERYSLSWREMHDAERGISCGSRDTRQLVTLHFKSWIRERRTYVLSLPSSFSRFWISAIFQPMVW